MRHAIIVACLFAVVSSAQSQRPSFEVATIKPSSVIGPIDSSPGRFIAAGQPLKGLLTYAYRMKDYQIVGGPNWMSTDRWEIQAKVPDGVIVPRPKNMEELEKALRSPNPIALMLQSLLEERFQLKMHLDTRELPIYELAIAKGGPKLILADDQSPIVFGTEPVLPQRLPNGLPALERGGYNVRGGVGGKRSFQGRAIALWQLVNIFVGDLGRPVVDKTNLKGLYDVKFEWAPQNLQAVPEAAPALASLLSTAIQEQLGLKLESTKGPVEVIVVDSAQKPSEN
jgi:uncharacterized protein (TIGR03435 family)